MDFLFCFVTFALHEKEVCHHKFAVSDCSIIFDTISIGAQL
jgi:hypothetical protein